jgi:tetratricopeptide (TPR) repeat protein
LWQQDDKQQEAVDLLFELAQEGHVDSINELFYIFLNQGDIDEAATVLELEGVDPAHSTLIYLHAELLEAQGRFDPSAFARAAEAGSAMAAFRLVNHFVLTDRPEAKYWLDKARKIGHRFLDQYQEEIEVYPEDRSFIIVCGSDESNANLEVRIYGKKDQVLLEMFDDLEEAITFCIEKNSGFEVRYVGDEWPNTSELAEDNSYSTYCRVIPDRDLVVIWRDSDLVWSGSTEEIDEAIEYLIENADQWWQLNYCDFVRQFEEDDEEGETTSRESQRSILPNTRSAYVSKLEPRIPGFRSSLVSFEENKDDGFLNINYETSFEGLWFPCDINEPNKCLKGVIHLALTLGYGQVGYGTLEGKSMKISLTQLWGGKILIF